MSLPSIWSLVYVNMTNGYSLHYNVQSVNSKIISMYSWSSAINSTVKYIQLKELSFIIFLFKLCT